MIKHKCSLYYVKNGRKKKVSIPGLMGEILADRYKYLTPKRKKI